MSIKVKIGADASEFSNTLNRVKSSTMSIGSAITGALGLSIGLAGFTAALKRTVDYLDMIGDEADKIGVSAEYFQQLAYAAKITNVDIAGVENAIKKMKVAIVSASSGNGELIYTFKKLGLNYKELMTMKPEQQFEAIAAALSKVENDTKRAAYTQELFGKGSQDLLPIIMNLAALKKQAAENQIFTDAEIKAASDFNDSLENIKLSLMGIISNSGAIKAIADALMTVDDLSAGKTEKMAKKNNIDTGSSTGRIFLSSMFKGSMIGDAIDYISPMKNASAAAPTADELKTNRDQFLERLKKIDENTRKTAAKMPGEDTGEL